MTGSYNNMFYVYDWENDVTTAIEANKNFPTTKIRTYTGKAKTNTNEPLDYSKKCLHVAIHPREDFVAVGASNNLFLYETGPEDEDSD